MKPPENEVVINERALLVVVPWLWGVFQRASAQCHRYHLGNSFKTVFFYLTIQSSLIFAAAIRFILFGFDLSFVAEALFC